MESRHFKSFSPFEIGDKVEIEGKVDLQEITDIACTHFIKTNTTKFTYELNNSGKYGELVLDE